MARRTGFAILLLIVAIASSQSVSSQDAAAKKTTESAEHGQGVAEISARLSKTHCDIPSCVQKILYFSNLSQPTDLQDVVNTIRVITDIQRIQQVLSSQIIIIEGTAEQVTMAEKLAAELDKDRRRFGGLGYRIDFKIQESEGDKKLHSRLYSFLTEARQGSRVSIERQPPPPAQNQPVSDNKQPAASNSSRNVECRILAENERTLELNVQAEFASAANESTGGTPPLLRLRTDVTLELDKPTVVGRVDDPDSDRSFTIELTAVRIKDRS